ncbi:MAG TPA: HlyD family secretion protein [Opitutaceae bacterium]|jgi:membrane fusion protein (multidrug efflux system)|nr:HlyD family secretion protein [Opitutaceae bacterium]
MNKPVADAAFVPAETSKSSFKASTKQMVIGTVAVIGLVVAVVYGVGRWRFAQVHEETDDAQVEGDISPVLPRVSGYVSQVLVVDNQRVEVGQSLMGIDSQELDLRIKQAEAALQNSVADKATADAVLATARSLEATARANIDTAEVRQRKAATDLARDTSLAKTGAITDTQLIDTRALADTATDQLESVKGEARTAEAQIKVAAARVISSTTMSEEKAADLAYAKLQRSYAAVPAPIAGVVSRKNVEPGQFVQAGQTLMSIASDTNVWVVANFKETQLTHMKAGQDVDFEADTYPGVIFHGKVESISGATGARFALLPPDNSTGNFVKVTQRVPVKIVLAQAPDAEHPLRPGMSVDATVSVQ